jgi:alkylation response protein AidB-like acyl-CoA dehydrogenase
MKDEVIIAIVLFLQTLIRCKISIRSQTPRLTRPTMIESNEIVRNDGSASQLRAELVDRARALIPVLEKNAAQTEANRRIVEENIIAIKQAGLFKIMVPRRFGGLETDFRTKLEVTRELAKGCGSTAWAMSLINGCAWLAGCASDRTQQDIWGANPNARLAGAFNPAEQSRRVDGGFVVSGRWPWASGCLHADWGFVGIPISEAASNVPELGFAFIPMSQLTIEDTWFAAGMKGTGSNTIVAQEVFVPDHRILPAAGLLRDDFPTPHKNEGLYRSSFMPAAALLLIGPLLGLATRALELVIENAPKRAIAYTFYAKHSTAPTFQLAIAKAATLVDTAHLHAYRAADAIDNAAKLGKKIGYVERARARMDTGYVAETAREAIRILCSAHGASSFSEASPLQRIWRDVEVASRHAIIRPEINAEIYGRALLGDAENVTPLV